MSKTLDCSDAPVIQL